MSAIRNDVYGMDSGLVVLHDLVSHGERSISGGALNAKLFRPTSESCYMRVVSKNVNDLLED